MSSIGLDGAALICADQWFKSYAAVKLDSRVGSWPAQKCKCTSSVTWSSSFEPPALSDLT